MGFRGRYKNKRDANEPVIVDTFLCAGCSVHRLDQPADLLVGYREQTHLVEVKVPYRYLNAAQREFREGWRGDFALVRSADEALELVKKWRNE